MTSNASRDFPSQDDDAVADHISAREKVPGRTNYYEKDGLRTYGDNEDHDHEPRMTFRRFDVARCYGVALDWKPNPSLPLRRGSAIHIPRYRWCGSMNLVHNRTLAVISINLPVCW